MQDNESNPNEWVRPAKRPMDAEEKAELLAGLNREMGHMVGVYWNAHNKPMPMRLLGGRFGARCKRLSLSVAEIVYGNALLFCRMNPNGGTEVMPIEIAERQPIFNKLELKAAQSTGLPREKFFGTDAAKVAIEADAAPVRLGNPNDEPLP